MKKTMTEPKYMTVKEFLEVVPIKKTLVYKLIQERKIPHLRFGKKPAIVIHPAALDIPRELITSPRSNYVLEELEDRLANIEKELGGISNMLAALKSLAEIETEQER
jgi:excisionase family DNA binding protein